MATRLEELVYRGNEQDELCDEDLITVQMIAIHCLQQDKAELVSCVKRLEEEKAKLVEMNQQQTAGRMLVLSNLVKRRGLGLKRQHDLLVALAEEDGPAQ